MMEAVFFKVLNMSITASYLVLAVIMARLLLKKAPKFISVILWGLVAVRLVCPFSIESILSLVPSAETVPQDIVYSNTPQIHSGISSVNTVVNEVVMPQFYPTAVDSVNPLQIVSFVASIVWVVGIVLMVLYTIFSYTKIYFKVREAVKVEGNIYECDRVESPFILGVIRPRIYLPSNMSDCDRDYVIAHERAHLKRRDHLWKPIGFLLLTVYWFNPVLWVAYILLCRDIELACDEKVIKAMGESSKKSYSDALINCSAPRKMITACPVAFGETGVKGRIKSVLNYKKPAFWVIIIAVVLSIAVAVFFMTNPATKITDLKDEKLDYSTVFNNAKTITAIMGNTQYSISYDEDIKEIKNQFEKIRVKETPIYHTDSNPRDTTNHIMIGENILYFSKDFSKFFGAWGPSSFASPSYEISNPHAAKKLFDLIENSESTRINTSLAVENVKAGTVLGGVTVSVKSMSLNLAEPYIELEIINESDNPYTLGQKEILYYNDDGEYVSCSTFKSSSKRKIIVHGVAHILGPNRDEPLIRKCSLKTEDLSKAGKYRLEIKHFWVEFELKQKYSESDNKDVLKDGYIEFYRESQVSFKTPIIASSGQFDKNDLDKLMKKLKTQAWQSGATTDRAVPEMYDGRIFHGGNWIYFGYNRNLITYDEYFVYVDDDIMNLIKNQEKNTTQSKLDLDTLKLKYPQYFGRDTAKGLEVYVWQMGENSYRCHLLSGRNLVYTDDYMDFSGGASIDEMRLILASYDMHSGNITVMPYRNPLSSYYYEIDEEYEEKIRALFGSGYAKQGPISFYATVFDTYENNVFVVTPLSNEEEYFVADKIEVTAKKVYDNNGKIPINKGDKVLVIYDGNILTNSPSTTSAIYHTRILDAEIGLCE